MTTSKSKSAPGSSESLDMAAIQAQLQHDRAQLAHEIGNRLGSLSPQKKGGVNGASGGSKSGQRPSSSNPFAMPAGAGLGGAAASSSSAPLFQHRPATLGLGATPTASQQGQAHASAQDRRLKGALLAGKRKRGLGDGDEASAATSCDEAHFEDSKSAALASVGGGGGGRTTENGVATDTAAAKKSARQRQDPFATRKGRGGKEHERASALNGKDSSLHQNGGTTNGDSKAAAEAPSLEGLSKSARKKRKKRMRMQAATYGGGGAEGHGGLGDGGASEGEAEIGSAAGKPEPASKARQGDASADGLTSAQRAMQSQLAGARFRQINETLYTTTSDEAVAMVQAEPETLRDYHQGFREQVKSWPQIPVRQIFDDIESAQAAAAAAAAGGPTKPGPGGVKGGTNRSSAAASSLGVAAAGAKSSGRRTPGALIVDLGAGDGFLAKWVAASRALAALPAAPRVLSFDLLDSADGWVRGVDIARAGALPLPGRDVAVSGASSSGGPHVEEGGADTDASRCADVAVFCLALMATNWLESILEASRVLRPGGELIIAEVASRLTDQRAFVDAVQDAGFTLSHEDTSNTHFVRLDFTKRATPAWRPPFRTAAERTAFVSRGAALLKPCIYKRR